MRVINLFLLFAATSLAAALSIDQRLASLESRIDALASDDEHDGEVAALKGFTYTERCVDESKLTGTPPTGSKGLCKKCANAAASSCAPLFVNKPNACISCEACDHWKNECAEEAKGPEVEPPKEEEEEEEEKEEATQCCMKCNKTDQWPFNNGLKCEAQESGAKFIGSARNVKHDWGCSKEDTVKDLGRQGTFCTELLRNAKVAFCADKPYLQGKGKPCEPPIE
jgi:hypothetical protein